MKINITKKEYKTLVEILEIADWVLHAHEIEKSEDTRSYREFSQKIFSLAKDFGFDHLIEYEKQLQEYFPTSEFEDTSPGMAFIEKFENESFWEDLIDRLVQRDLIRELGEEKIILSTPWTVWRRKILFEKNMRRNSKFMGLIGWRLFPDSWA